MVASYGRQTVEVKLNYLKNKAIMCRSNESYFPRRTSVNRVYAPDERLWKALYSNQFCITVHKKRNGSKRRSVAEPTFVRNRFSTECQSSHGLRRRVLLASKRVLDDVEDAIGNPVRREKTKEETSLFLFKIFRGKSTDTDRYNYVVR